MNLRLVESKMVGYLIGEEGPLVGVILTFEGKEEWVLGRDPDEVEVVLEDPMVSRKHVICRHSSEGFVLENLSIVNPATQNGKVISEPVLMQEGDIIQIGNTFFRFSEHPPGIEKPLRSFTEESTDLTMLSVVAPPNARWMIKVIAGPNAGAEFYMQKGKQYVVGKEASSCDIVLQDLSVSRQHAKITVDDSDVVSIEDLGSRNGTLVGGIPIATVTSLSSAEVVSLGTTSFFVIDRELSQETVLSEVPVVPVVETAAEPTVIKGDWKDRIIPRKYLVIAGVIGVVLLGLFVSMASLFHTQSLPSSAIDEADEIRSVMARYPDVQFSYNRGSGKLFMTGHVLTPIEHQELSYQLAQFLFLQQIEDTIVIDEYVWENMNALLITNPAWTGISIHSPKPGAFVLRGYLANLEQAQMLADYLNIHFPYLDRLDNQVVVESTLHTQIASLIMRNNFSNVVYQSIDGELVFSGRVDGKDRSKFDTMLSEIHQISGIRSVKNYVVFANQESSFIDLSQKYRVMGSSKKDGSNQFVVINGKILTLGDTLDGMVITDISSHSIALEKDGLKFKIHYNLQ